MIVNRGWIVLLVVASACSAPYPEISHVSTTQTAMTPQVVETIPPHSEPDTSLPESPSPASTSSPDLGWTQLHIDADISHQRLDGFGATHISLEYQGGSVTLNRSLRLQAIEMVYKDVGINLGNLEGALLESPGSYDQRSNDDKDPEKIHWQGFQTFPADAIQSSLLSFAEPFGFDGYYIDQRVNIRWASPWLAELRNADYARYLDEVAEQVVAGVIYWRDQYGVIPRYIMVFNEPLSGNSELQSSNVQEVVDLVKAIGSRLEREGFRDVRFVLPNEETVARSLEVAEAVLSDDLARKYVGVIGYHSYPYGSPYSSIPRLLSTSGVGVPDADSLAARDKLRQLGQQYNLPVWMTEVSHGEVDPTSYDNFRGRAIHIHDELVYAHASAYFGMNNMWDTFSQEAHFGNRDLFDYSSEGTIVLIDSDRQKVYITGMGYAIGHYARWVEPGSVRVEALSSDALVQVTAFRTPDLSQLILVLINNHPESREIRADINAAVLSGAVSGEQSTANRYWAPLQDVSIVSPGEFETTLPSESVTTLVLQLDRN